MSEGWNGNQIPTIREFTSKGSGRFKLLGDAAAAAGKVTVDRAYQKTIKFDGTFQVSHFGQTFFKEVKVAPPKMTKKVKSFASGQHKISKMPALQAITQVIERDWNPDKFNVCLHSSGYDSRIISGILMKLREKHGWGWIGKILFLCNEPEGKIFKRIMKWEGWKPSQYHVYKEGVTVDYREELLGFRNIWKWVNGYDLPWNVSGCMVEDAKRRGVIPENAEIHALGGRYGNEIENINRGKYNRLKVIKKNVKLGRFPNPLADKLVRGWYYGRDISAICSAMPVNKFKLPYTDIDVAPHFTNRRNILRKISKELYAFPRLVDKVINSPPNWFGAPKALSKSLRKKIARDFNDSWYAKNRNPQKLALSPKLDRLRWWRNYVVASTCEHLQELGVKVRL